MPFATEQEDFWAGNFGDDYTRRNRGLDVVAANTALFARILARLPKLGSVVELGANIGMNLLALRNLLPGAKMAAVEINGSAAAELRRIDGVEVTVGSLFDYAPQVPADLAFVKGVLIHIAPERLPDAYAALYRSSARYLCLAEYYNPSPVEVPYRGHSGRLFKRDFAGELLDRYADLRLVDYGFVWRRDVFAQDDLTWFVLEKR
jgi:spore coat polysaccharide biosynthesis protein SpsF